MLEQFIAELVEKAKAFAAEEHAKGLEEGRAQGAPPTDEQIAAWKSEGAAQAVASIRAELIAIVDKLAPAPAPAPAPVEEVPVIAA